MYEKKFKSRNWENLNVNNNPDHGPNFEFSKSIIFKGKQESAEDSEISGRFIMRAWLLICL